MSIHRYLAAAAVSVAVAATLTAGTATAAPQSTQLTLYKITSASTHRCLDSNAYDVYTLDCNGSRNQKWDNYAPGKFKNDMTHECIYAGSGAVMMGNVCDDPVSNFTTSSTTNKYIKSVNTGTCLDNNGGNATAVGLKACRAGTELWNITTY
jgi:hypothetical protein